jgi:hypothetical protein
MQDTAFLPNPRSTIKEKNAITFPQANRHVLILRQYKARRIPKKVYIGRRDVQNHNTQIKT